MNELDLFRQEKSSFLICFFSYITISFLAVCILFGIYIYCSFNTQTNMEQSISGDYNSQEMNK